MGYLNYNGRLFTWEEVYKISGLVKEDFSHAYAESLEEFAQACREKRINEKP